MLLKVFLQITDAMFICFWSFSCVLFWIVLFAVLKLSDLFYSVVFNLLWILYKCPLHLKCCILHLENFDLKVWVYISSMPLLTVLHLSSTWDIATIIFIRSSPTNSIVCVDFGLFLLMVFSLHFRLHFLSSSHVW